MPFLKFAMEHMFEKYCLQVSPNVNRNPGGQAEDAEEGEWVDIDDDSDDEISFPTRSIQVPTTQPIPTGTEQSTTARQQDEYLDYREGQAADAFNDAGILNKSIYVSADEGDYNEQVAYDDYNETYYTPDAATTNTDTGLYHNTHEQNIDSVGGDSQSHVDWSQNVENRIVSGEGIRELEEAYPDDGYATEIGTQYITQQQITGTVPSSYNTTTYTHRIAQDEFMGQFDDIDEIAYATVSQIPSHVVKPEINLVIPRTVLVHEWPQQVYQEPLIVHQVHEVLGGTSSPKKAFPPPRWPVDEVSPRRRQAPKTATITSIFHEDEAVNGGRGGNKDTNDTNKDTNTYEFFHTYPDITGEKDLLAGNARRQGRNPPNRPNRGRQNQNPINVRRNPNRAARGILGRGPAPQPQPGGPQPQLGGPQPQPGGPQPQPGGPQPQPGGPQPQLVAPHIQPGGPGPVGPGGPVPSGPGGLGPGGPGGVGRGIPPRRGRGQPNRGCGQQPPQPPPNPNNPQPPPNPNNLQPPNQNPPQPPNPNPPAPPANPAPGAPNQPTDPGLVAILNRLVQAQEKQASDKNESKRFTQFPTVKFDGSAPEKSLDHWNLFMQYWIYVLGKGYVPQHTDHDYYTIFCQQFILTLTGIAYTWFKQIQDNFNDINDVKAAFLKRFNEWGQTVKQHMTAWNSLKFDVQQHDMDVFTRKLRLLASILYMTDDQTLEKFKDSFDTNIAAHLIECEMLAEA